MLKVAITGNIASGKSQAELIFAKYYPVYDTDKIAHEILDNITEFYGYDVFTDGKIDRKKLGELVFNNHELKTKLEELVHPKIRENLKEIFKAHRRDKMVFVSVPLLFEAGFKDMFDKTILISAKENLRLKRLMARNNFTREEALKRIKSQMSEDLKKEYVDFVITNNADFENLETQAKQVIKQLKNKK